MVAAVACVPAARGVAAQSIPDINAPKRAAMKAADSTNARLAAQTGQAIPQRKGTTAPAPTPKPSGPAAAQPAVKGTQSAGQPAGAAAAPLPAGMQPVTREVYAYEQDGRRDPFFSLILTEELRPLLSDLKLVGIVYDPSGRRSVGTMRDNQTNTVYRVTVGSTLGRMRVAQIKPRAVIFSIDEFGFNRLDSLFMADSTKRIR